MLPPAIQSPAPPTGNCLEKESLGARPPIAMEDPRTRFHEILAVPDYKDRALAREVALTWLSTFPAISSFIDKDLVCPSAERDGYGQAGDIYLSHAEPGVFFKRFRDDLLYDSYGSFHPVSAGSDIVIAPPSFAKVQEIFKLAALRELGFAGAIPILDAVGLTHDCAIFMKLRGLANGYAFDDENFRRKPLAERIDLCIRAGERLNQIHEFGWRHGDTKARNIITDGQDVMWIDLGGAEAMAKPFVPDVKFAYGTGFGDVVAECIQGRMRDHEFRSQSPRMDALFKAATGAGRYSSMADYLEALEAAAAAL